MSGDRLAGRRVAMPKKGGLVFGLMLFVTVAVTIVMVNSFGLGYGLHWDYSISKYVGLELWSTIAFAVGNMLVAAVAGRYAWKLGEAWKMPRMYFYSVFVMVVALIWLSMCPTVLCDVGEKKSLISWMHFVASRTMFLAMLIVGAMLALYKKASERTRTWSAIFVAYGVICVLGYLMEGGWFRLLVCESLYIDGFMGVLLVQKGKEVG